MPLGESLTRWTVRVALALYVVALTLRVATRSRAGRSQVAHNKRRPDDGTTHFSPLTTHLLRFARLTWTLGCVAFLVHVACAFAFYHQWSHAEAYEFTRRRTAEVTGLNWGGGLYANYVFAAVWLADVAWWWIGKRRYENRPRAVGWAIQAFMAFIAFNSTVAFGTGAIRWFGLAASVWLVAILLFHRRRPSRTSSPRPVQME